MMELDEAIKHCLEVAEENDLAAGTYEILAENNHNAYERLTAETNSSRCTECAADHRQLAEWLTELKELREENINLKNDNERLRDCVDSCIHNGELDYAELAESKRLLKAAVEGFNFLGAWMDEHGDCTLDCSDCPLHRPGYYCRGWNKEDEALALILEEGDTNG